MRIDSQYNPQSAPEPNRANALANSSTASSTVAAADTSAVASPGEDQAQLSGAYVSAEALSSQALQLPEIREQKVQSLRQAVLSGQYQASPQNVAQALFAHMAVGKAA
jgi:flagellar biosynthesis anti-sigma factor FlgM